MPNLQEDKVSLSDDELVLRAQTEDPEALQELISIMTPVINSQAISFIKNDIDLEDLMQHAWLHFFKNNYRVLKMYTPQPEGTFKAFVATTSFNCFLNYTQKAKRRRMVSITAGADRADGAVSPELVSTMMRISQENEECRDNQLIAAGILAEILPILSEKRRSALEENLVEGKTYEEIANERGVDRKTIGSAIFNAREKLREVLRKMGFQTTADIFGTSGISSKKGAARRGKQKTVPADEDIDKSVDS